MTKESKVIQLKRETASESTIDTSKLEEVSSKIKNHKPSLSIGDITEPEKYAVHTISVNIEIAAPFSIEDEVIDDNTKRCEDLSVEFLNSVIIPTVTSVAEFIEAHPEYDCFKQEVQSGTKSLFSFASSDRLRMLTDELVNSL